MLRRLLVAACCAGAGLWAQAGTTPKATAAEYPAQTSAGKVELGGEYLGHSFSASGVNFLASDYLVIEVAVYPPARETLALSPGQFALRLNGKKQALSAQAPEFVAASLKNPEWEDHTRMETAVGPVVMGRPAPVERFPGDPTARRRVPPQSPTPEESNGIEKPVAPKADEAVLQTALPEAEIHAPVSGYLYFRYSGRLKSLRSVDLVYTGADGETELKLGH